MRHVFTSYLLLAFVYGMIKLNYDHAINRHTRVEGREREDDN